MTLRYILIIVSYLLDLLLIVSIPLRAKQIDKKTGECKLLMHRKVKVVNFPALVLCLVLISVLIFRDLGILMNTVICLTALLGTYIISNVMIFNKKKGVYQNGIIISDQFIPFTEIISIPSFEWEDREISDSFDVITEKHGTQTIQFSSSEECNAAAELIIQLEPRLK